MESGTQIMRLIFANSPFIRLLGALPSKELTKSYKKLYKKREVIKTYKIL